MKGIQLGLSLIELLVSLVIAGILFSGVVGVVQSSRVTFNSEQESGFIQENARYVIETLSRDIRHAGYLGCFDRTQGGFGYALEPTESFDDLYSPAAVTGFEAGNLNGPLFDTTPGILPDSDAVIIRFADQEGVMRVSSQTDAEIQFSENHDMAVGDVNVIVNLNCQNASVFRVRAVTSDSLSPSCGELYTEAPAEDFQDVDSCAEMLTYPSARQFAEGSVVMPYYASAYFVADSEVVPGLPALKRRVVRGNSVRTEELAQGVERINFSYGIDSDADGVVNQFLAADQLSVDAWTQVTAMRFEVLFRSQVEVFESPQEYIFDGEPITPDDGFMRQLASSTVKMRNR